MIVVTAPTSNIGHQLLANILNAGEPIRVIARDPSRLPARTRERAEIVQGHTATSMSSAARLRAPMPCSGWYRQALSLKALRLLIWTSPNRLARRSRAGESGA